MPTGKQQIIYWDTCVFLAWIKDEVRAAGDMEGVKKVAELVLKDELILITSMLTRAEILQSKITPDQLAKYDKVTRRSNVVPQDLDLPVAVLTSKIRDYYINSDFELLTPDAIHLATAIHYNADEFQTFDGCKQRTPRNAKYTRCGLLLLDGNVAGHKLRVCKPSAEQYELRLRAIAPGASNNAQQPQEAMPGQTQPTATLLRRSDNGRTQGQAASTGAKAESEKEES